MGRTCWAALPAANAHTLVGKAFFPSLIAAPFKDGIVDVLIFAAAMCLVAALASWLRGGKFVHEEAHVVHGRKAKQVHAHTEAPPRSEAQTLSEAHARRETHGRSGELLEGPASD